MPDGGTADALRVAWHWGADALGPRFRSRSELLAWQDRRVHAHLRWLVRHSPYYRDLYAGLDLRDRQVLPVTGKADVMRHFDRVNTVGVTLAEALAVAERAERDRDFRSTVRGVTVGLSSGTSGSRGVFLVSRAERLRWAALMLRRLLPGHPLTSQRVAFFLRADSNLYRSVRSRTVKFEFFDLLRPLEEQFARLSAAAPTVLVAPPSALRVIAEHGPTLNPRVVVSVAEVLEEQDRAVIEARLGPVRQVYQATEGLLGFSCAHGTLHLNEEFVAFDLEDAGDGRFTPVVTDFTRRALPVVRYHMNDLLVPRQEPCPCGSPRLAIERVEGRSDDVLHLPGVAGRQVRVFPDFVRRALMRAEGVREYRAVQVGPADLRVELLPDSPDARGAAARELEGAWRELGVTGVRVTFEPYAFTPGGRKLRRVERTRETTPA